MQIKGLVDQFPYRVLDPKFLKNRIYLSPFLFLLITSSKPLSPTPTQLAGAPEDTAKFLGLSLGLWTHCAECAE